MSANDVVTFREPVLLSKLRIALAHLYGIGTVNTANHTLDAHSYLIEFQARNTRRKAIALQQRLNDKKDRTSTALLPREDEYIGSSFYACLPSLLLSIPAHDTERLFSAQTILHRLRRMKLSEAIDFEIEYHHEQNSIMSVEAIMHMTSDTSIPLQEQTLYWTRFLHFHCQTLSSFHPVLLGKVLDRYSQQWSDTIGQHFNIRSASDLEERIKGEITLHTLATAAYLNGFLDIMQESNEDHSKIGPLLQTLSSAMAVTALRLRYTPSDPSSPATQIPIVSQVVNSFQIVFEIATSLSVQELVSGFNLPAEDHNLLNIFHQHNSLIHTRALCKCVCIALASVPDALLGSEGGARGRLSIDPKCIQSTNVELRTFDTGIGLLQQTIMQLNALQMERDTSSNSQVYLKEQILGASERWARFVSLTHEFVEAILTTAQTDLSTLERINQIDNITSYDKIYFAFLTRIFEAASMTPEEIIAASAGLTLDSGSQQAGRKRQSSKSKKRHKQKLLEVIEGGGESSVDMKQEEATIEVRLRGSIASYAARIAWEKVYPLYRSSLNRMDASPNTVVEGEGVIGCICTCVSACIPHYINNGAPQADSSMVLVGLLFEALKEICSSSNSSVRALSFEHIIGVHKALVNVQPLQNFDDLYYTITQSLSDCALTLSEKCDYPNTYFDRMELNNIEELEIERNDVRDIIRAICSFDFGVEEFSRFSVTCLERTIHFCHQGITDRPSLLPSETLVHVLSSPAKSIHGIALGLVSGSFRDNILGESIISKALDALYQSCVSLHEAFQDSYPLAHTLPISRLVTIIIASFSPIFACIVENKASFSNELFIQLEQTIGIGLQIICESLVRVPELVSASTLDDTSYDIRGAMRSPGGEDHCSCIALMRLVRDSDSLTQAIIPLTSNYFKKSKQDVLMDIVNVYTYLYSCEQERPPGQMHGKGVTPKSRRVFLNSMSKLGLCTLKSDPSSADRFGQIFSTIFEKSINTVISSHHRCDLSVAERNYLICESCYDLAAFPSSYSKEVFKESNQTWSLVVEILLEGLLSGYDFPVTGNSSDEGLAQWVRMRGGFLTLLRSCADPDLPELAIEATKKLIKKECSTVACHFSQMFHNESSIFNEPNICEDVLSSGAFIIVIRDVLTKMNYTSIDESTSKCYFKALEGCLEIMDACKEDIYSVINLRGPLISSGWEDPRMPIAEAWYLSLSELISLYQCLNLNYDERMLNLVCETLSVVLYLTLFRRTEKEVAQHNSIESMSLDGPVTLALIDFLGDAIGLGYSIFSRVGIPFVDKVTLENCQGLNDLNHFGGSMLAVALYRGSSGAFPPWFIESVPTLFEALFNACVDIDTFMIILKTGAELIANIDLGFVPAGSKLAGYYFNVTKASAKEEFFIKTAELSRSTEGNRWRRMKVLLKAICGGKKKATDFNLKPQPSSWDCERI